MSCLESIFTKCNQAATLKQELARHPDLKPSIVCLMWKSDNYWVRLSCQRVINFMMLESDGAEGLVGSKEEVLKLMYKMLSVLNFAYVTETLCNQLVSNLETLLKKIDPESLIKVFKKASYIGRRILVSAILQLISQSHLFRATNRTKPRSSKSRS